MFGFDECCFAV
jgi:hypothetical protein